MKITKAISLTAHAYERLNQRSILTTQQLFEYTSNHLYVHVGSDLEENKEHFIFYSIIDKDFYCMVVDSQNSEVITILSAKEFRNGKKDVKRKHLKLAEKLAKKHKFKTIAPSKKSLKAEVSLGVLVAFNPYSKQRYKSLGHLLATITENGLLVTRELKNKLKKAIEAKKVKLEDIEVIVFRRDGIEYELYTNNLA